MGKPYYIYMLECDGNMLYTGITTDLEKRMREHFLALPACAKFTRSHKPKKLVGLWTAPDRAVASKLEYCIKALPRAKKDALLMSPETVSSVATGLEDCRAAEFSDINKDNIQ